MKVHVPMPILVVVDDVGWWCGEDGSRRGEPYRTGMGRDHGPADYRALVALGRRLRMRVQAAMVLCEWDRTNLLRRVPTATWQGKRWDNRRWQGPWLDEAAGILADGRAWVEIALHGVGHEYWTAGRMSRAEWCTRTGRMRSRAEIERHLDAYAALLEQNRLGPFPVSFVPSAFQYRFGDGDRGVTPLFAARGIRWVSLPRFRMHEVRPLDEDLFGLECGMLFVDRGRDLLPWYESSTPPDGEVRGPICGIHWAGILHRDPARNGEIVEAWARRLEEDGRQPDRILAPDTASMATQLVYRTGTGVNVETNTVRFDFARVRSDAVPGLRDSFAVKVECGPGVRFQSTDLLILSSRREANCTVLTLRRLPGTPPAGTLHRIP